MGLCLSQAALLNSLDSGWRRKGGIIRNSDDLCVCARQCYASPIGASGPWSGEKVVLQVKKCGASARILSLRCG